MASRRLEVWERREAIASLNDFWSGRLSPSGGSKKEVGFCSLEKEGLGLGCSGVAWIVNEEEEEVT